MPNPILNLPNVVLASASPRRYELLKSLGIAFKVVKPDTDESFSVSIAALEVAPFLARKKAEAYSGLKTDEILITCDTTVCLDGMVINKPENKDEARQMLQTLSGRDHTVVTGVCLRSAEKEVIFSEKTLVRFKKLTENEIDYYLEHFKPYDKAGAYGIQDWIGFIGVERIEGCFYNVMGLPVARLYKELVGWIGGDFMGYTERF
jgi:septum formation protein